MAHNQSELTAILKKLDGCASTIHFDVADGKSAPSKVMDFPFRLSSRFKYQAHLMIKNPETWIKKHPEINLCIPQFEEVKNIRKYIDWMRKKHRKIAFALKPETKVGLLRPFLQDVDYILILTVHPGFYGGKYLKSELKKILPIKRINPQVKVIVDGGMNPQTLPEAIKAGADYFVSGSFVVGSDNPKKALQRLTKIGRKMKTLD